MKVLLKTLSMLRRQKTPINKRFRKMRYSFIHNLTKDVLDADGNYKTVLEVGCHTGRDFLKYLTDRSDVKLHGLDIKDYGFRAQNFEMIIGDAENIDFPDKYFDLAVSFGVFEHIQPMEKLSTAIKEIDRVSKNYVVMVPAINSLLEPHTCPSPLN